jgi:hypothetical protein
MSRTLAEFLLRLYPRAWRMRYEEEVRALLDDRAPDWRDVAGLIRGAGAEWTHSVVDPYEHPVLSGLLRGLGHWLALTAAIGLTAGAVGNALRVFAGEPPAWVGLASAVTTLVVPFRAWGAQLGLGRIPIGVHGRTLGFGLPLSARQARFWWSALWTAVALGHWSGDFTFGLWQIWWTSVVFLSSATQSSWNRTLAQRELWRLRRELRWASREHLRLGALVVRNLATPAELEVSAGDIARLNRAIRIAADAIRTAQPIAKLESNQTCR